MPSKKHETQNRSNLKRKLALFGFTLGDWPHLIEKGCAICGSPTPRWRGAFHLDHCHKTNVFRGVLCGPCNLLLGHAHDDPTILRLAADYLESAPGKGIPAIDPDQEQWRELGMLIFKREPRVIP